MTPRNTDLVSGFPYLVNLYVPASLAIMVPRKQRRSPVLFAGSEAGKQNSKCCRNSANNDGSLKEVGDWGKHFAEVQPPLLSLVTQAFAVGFRRSQYVNLSLFKLAKYSSAVTWERPRHKKNRQRGGVGSSVKACSVRYWHVPCLSAACQWTPHCGNDPYCCCQHSHTLIYKEQEVHTACM